MRKILFQFFILACAFFLSWFLLRKVNWMGLFGVEVKTDKIEQKLGDFFWELTTKTEEEITNDSLIKPLDTLLTHICEANAIDRSQIKLHLLKKDEVNAFALPDNHLVVFSGLINSCKNEAELCGVIAHEIAHMQKKHVMKKLGKEIGLSTLIAMTTGSNSPETIKRAIRLLSSAAYDRSLEDEADMTAIDYLQKADISPSPFADFLYRLSLDEGDIRKQLTWVSTHDDSESRSEKIIEKVGTSAKGKKSGIVSSVSWNNLTHM